MTKNGKMSHFPETSFWVLNSFVSSVVFHTHKALKTMQYKDAGIRGNSEALDRMIFAICTDYGIEEGVDSDYYRDNSTTTRLIYIYNRFLCGTLLTF